MLAHPLPSGMRDLLPSEAARRRKLAKRLLDHFALHGYMLVTPPAFELASVLERGLGALDPGDVLRFVEPESGEVAALRPDMTPQIARMAATRLSDRPKPLRLCYEGTVLRRRQERARKHRQIPQAGIELLGAGEPEGDIELLSLAASSLRAAGLSNFVLDIGHAEIARALIGGLPKEVGPLVLDALAQKDAARIDEIASRKGAASGASLRALRELPRLYGDASIWGEAEAWLRDTEAMPAFEGLRASWDRAIEAGLGPHLRVDFGEVRGFAYYTGIIFHFFAEGPGEPLGSGGRYDDLLGRFGAPMPAAGFALDLDNLAWALRAAGREEARDLKICVAPGERGATICAEFRAEGIACVLAPSASEGEVRRYAEAWECSHWLSTREGELVLTDVASRESARFASLPELTAWLRARPSAEREPPLASS